MKRFGEWVKKHKWYAIGAAAVGLIVIYVLNKSGSGGLTSGNGSGGAVSLVYPTSSQAPVLASSAASSTRTGAHRRSASRWATQQSINLLLAQEIAAKAAGQAPGATPAPNTPIPAHPVSTAPKKSSVLQRVVLAASPSGKLAASPNYKLAVNTAGGYYKNHVFQRGKYQGNKFVKGSAKHAKARGANTAAARSGLAKGPSMRFRAIP